MKAYFNNINHCISTFLWVYTTDMKLDYTLIFD